MGGIRGSDENKRGRIVVTINGPDILRLQFRHVPNDWVIRSRPAGFDLEREIERFRRAAVKAGWEVDEGVAVEDFRRNTEDTSF